MEAKGEGKGQCWDYGNPRVEVAHIIARQDTAIPFLESNGLINFDLTSRNNAMGLCPICHAEFDDMTNPGFIFWPQGLDFFYQVRAKRPRTKTPTIIRRGSHTKLEVVTQVFR